MPILRARRSRPLRRRAPDPTAGTARPAVIHPALARRSGDGAEAGQHGHQQGEENEEIHGPRLTWLCGVGIGGRRFHGMD